MAERVKEEIEKLTVEVGQKNGKIWHATFTVKEVLARAEMPNTPTNQNHVRYVVNRFYPGSKVLPPQRDDGGTLEMKIRSV